MKRPNTNDFRDFFEGQYANFGLDDQEKRAKEPYMSELDRDQPVKMTEVKTITDTLKEHQIGDKLSYSPFIDEVRWGVGAGALRCGVQPDMHLQLDRLGIDLQGEPVWITKRLYLLSREGYGGHESVVVEEVLDELDEINNTAIDSPKSTFEDLKYMVHSMAYRMRATARDIFLFNGINKLNENEYIIRFGVRGQGVAAPDQSRVLENHTIVGFTPDSGRIHLINRNVESSIGRMEWLIRPADTNVYFFPTQSIDEMIAIMGTTMKYY